MAECNRKIKTQTDYKRPGNGGRRQQKNGNPTQTTTRQANQNAQPKRVRANVKRELNKPLRMNANANVQPSGNRLNAQSITIRKESNVNVKKVRETRNANANGKRNATCPASMANAEKKRKIENKQFL